MTDVSLAWLNRRAVAPVIGLTSIQRMEQALGARGKELTEVEEAYLEEPYVVKPIEGHF